MTREQAVNAINGELRNLLAERVAEAVAAERERCAVLAETMGNPLGLSHAYIRIAAAIRGGADTAQPRPS